MSDSTHNHDNGEDAPHPPFPAWRSPLLLVIDIAALVAAVGFSVAAAVEPDTRAYVIGQIIAAAVLIARVAFAAWQRANHHSDRSP